MNRISGIEKSQAPWHLRWFYTTMRKMFGKDLTPVKQQMRLPGMADERGLTLICVHRENPRLNLRKTLKLFRRAGPVVF